MNSVKTLVSIERICLHQRRWLFWLVSFAFYFRVRAVTNVFIEAERPPRDGRRSLPLLPVLFLVMCLFTFSVGKRTPKWKGRAYINENKREIFDTEMECGIARLDVIASDESAPSLTLILSFFRLIASGRHNSPPRLPLDHSASWSRLEIKSFDIVRILPLAEEDFHYTHAKTSSVCTNSDVRSLIQTYQVSYTVLDCI